MKWRVFFLALIGLLPQSGSAQEIGSLSVPATPQVFVRYVTESQVVSAGKRNVIRLRFQVKDGFHINSNTPKSDLLVPTVLLVQTAEGVRAEEPQYPAGSEYSFSFDPGEKLSVYFGSFTVTLAVSAAPGEHTLQGVLKYQACDHAACYPPKSLPLSVVITTR